MRTANSNNLNCIFLDRTEWNVIETEMNGEKHHRIELENGQSYLYLAVEMFDTTYLVIRGKRPAKAEVQNDR